MQIYARAKDDALPIETNRNKIKRRLEREGWYLARHGSSHDIYRHPSKSGTITLPRHRTLTPGVVRTIAAQAGWTD